MMKPIQRLAQREVGDVSLQVCRDNDGKNHESSGVADKLGVYAIPTIFLIDKDDKVVLVCRASRPERRGQARRAALSGLGVRRIEFDLEADRGCRYWTVPDSRSKSLTEHLRSNDHRTLK